MNLDKDSDGKISAGEVIWFQAKRANQRDWPNKVEQLYNFLRRK